MKSFDRRFHPLPVKDYVISAEELEKIKEDFPLVLITSSIILFLIYFFDGFFLDMRHRWFGNV